MVSVKYNVIGSKGPYAVAETLRSKGITAAITGRQWMSGTHNPENEWATLAAWDAKYRPTKVYGDDTKCNGYDGKHTGSCEWCTVNKDNISQKHGLA